MTVSVQASATAGISNLLPAGSTGNATCPTTVAGDLIVVANIYDDFDSGVAPSNNNYPSGFTGIGVRSSTEIVARAAYKIASGSEGGTTITGMGLSGSSTTDAVYMGIYTFRSNLPPLFGIGAASTDFPVGTGGNPAGATVTSGGGTPPLIVFGLYWTYNGGGQVLSPRTFSTTKDGEINMSSAVGQTSCYLAYKIYNSSPANTTVDMDDEGTYNWVGSWYLTMSETSVSVGQPTRKRGGGVPGMEWSRSPRGGKVWMPERRLYLPPGFKKAA